MFTITPIGSCRIATPLRLGQEAHGIRMNLARCYGYCHSPAEAVQMARFLRGEITIPEDVWPLVSRSHQLSVLERQTHEPSDLYVIELASAKQLTIDGVSIQLNYLRSNFPEFFSDPERAQDFWEQAQDGDTAAFLDRHWSAGAAQRADSALLSRIRMTLVTPESLRADIETLAGLLPDLFFVSHVDAVKPDGSEIKSRSAFIRLVAEEVRAAGLPFYDPTELMTEFGQSEAIEDDSTSLAHFTTRFSETVMADWMHRFIAPKADSMAARDSRAAQSALAQIEAARKAGRHSTAAVRIEAIARENPEFHALLQDTTRDQIAAQKAFAETISDRAGAPMTREAFLDCIREAGALGLFDMALALASGAKGGPDALPCPLLTDLACRAADAGDIFHATEFALAARRGNDGALRAARLLAELALGHGLDLSHRLDAARLAGIQTHFTTDALIEALGRPDAPLRTLVARALSAEDVTRIAATLADRHGLAVACRVVAAWRATQGAAPVRDEGLSALLEYWTAHAMRCTDPLERARHLTRIQSADPRHPDLRKALREAKLDLVARMRAAGQSRDIGALMALSEEVDTLDLPLPEFDIWRARLHFETGDHERAIAFGTSAAELSPDRINVWTLLMRAGENTGDNALAARAADRVIALSGPRTRKLETEARNLRQRLLAEV